MKLRKSRLSWAGRAMVVTSVAFTSACVDDVTNEEPRQEGESSAEPASVASERDALGDGALAGASASQELYQSCTNESLFLDPSKFEFVPPWELENIFIQWLPEPTAFGEDTLIHVRLPPSGDQKLDESLVRVIGSQKAPLLLFRSDALAELGHIEQSPGDGFFTTFAQLDEKGLGSRRERDDELLATEEVQEQRLVFSGRNPVALSTFTELDVDAFFAGKLIGLGAGRIMPASIQQNWDEAVFITDPAVVRDPERTYDTCTQTGTSCGPWTFCHLMKQMANTPRTGISPEQFTRQWLEQWLSDVTVNADTVDARAQMWTQIVQPWLAASGGEALDLERAPFRLLAIVNRLDLRQTSAGGSGYGTSGGGVPLDAGELRFVFGVMRPDATGAACEPLPFTVIFEYGVPVTGCENVRSWALDWTALDAIGGFGPSYRAKLEQMTQQVVSSNAAPHKGNGSALNQIRTNENALDPTWELREFTLTDQTIGCNSSVDVPRDGFLATHTVGQTPDDAVFAPSPDPVIDAFINNHVVPTVPSTGACSSSHEVPPSFACDSDAPIPFLGANSLASLVPGGSPPGSWLTSGLWYPSDRYVCGRQQFSQNTCNGCHTCDTGTTFTHVDPMSGIPASLSGFLTGTTVVDAQFSGRSWSFADLDRRYQDLYRVSGSLCAPLIPFIPEIFEAVDVEPFGPVFDIGIMGKMFELRPEFLQPDLTVNPVLDDFATPAASFVH